MADPATASPSANYNPDDIAALNAILRQRAANYGTATPDRTPWIAGQSGWTADPNDPNAPTDPHAPPVPSQPAPSEWFPQFDPNTFVPKTTYNPAGATIGERFGWNDASVPNPALKAIDDLIGPQTSTPRMPPGAPPPPNWFPTEPPSDGTSSYPKNVSPYTYNKAELGSGIQDMLDLLSGNMKDVSPTDQRYAPAFNMLGYDPRFGTVGGTQQSFGGLDYQGQPIYSGNSIFGNRFTGAWNPAMFSGDNTGLIKQLNEALGIIDAVNPQKQPLPKQDYYIYNYDDPSTGKAVHGLGAPGPGVGYGISQGAPGATPGYIYNYVDPTTGRDVHSAIRPGPGVGYGISQGGPGEAPRWGSTPPPSGDTLTPADRTAGYIYNYIDPSTGQAVHSATKPGGGIGYGISIGAEGQAPQSYIYNYTDPNTGKVVHSQSKPPPGVGYGISLPAAQAPAVDPNAIPDYARPYHTLDPAHTPYLPGQQGWLSEGPWYYPDFGGVAPTQTFTSYPAAPPVGGGSSGGGIGPGPGVGTGGGGLGGGPVGDGGGLGGSGGTGGSGGGGGGGGDGGGGSDFAGSGSVPASQRNPITIFPGGTSPNADPSVVGSQAWMQAQVPGYFS